MSIADKTKVLFVCMGNICRSPTAEGVFRKLALKHFSDQLIHIDSCGTIGYHVGEAPDSRSVEAAKLRGYDLSSQRSRKFSSEDFDNFDYILVMDKANKNDLISLAGQNQDYLNKIQLFLEYTTQKGIKEVPDPYYGGSQGFNYVIDLIEDASRGLIEHLLKG